MSQQVKISPGLGVSMAFPIGSMGLVYLPMYIWLIFMVNVGKYTSLMDPMGMAFYPDSTMTSLQKNTF